MSKRDESVLLEDMIDSIQKIESYIAGFDWSSFANDSKTIDAVVRNLEIIGEAANQMPSGYKEKNSSINWNKIIGLRHRIVHAYFGVDIGIIWQIVTKDIPKLKKDLYELI